MSARRPSKVVIFRDCISFALGWLLIFQQALFVDPSQVNLAFLIVAAGLVGTPTGAEALARIKGGNGTPASYISSAPHPSSPSSSSSGADNE